MLFLLYLFLSGSTVFFFFLYTFFILKTGRLCNITYVCILVTVLSFNFWILFWISIVTEYVLWILSCIFCFEICGWIVLLGFELIWFHFLFLLNLGNADNGDHLKEDLSSLWEYVCLLSCFEIKITTAGQTLQKTACWYLP
jgi:hypothetical protein